MTWKALQTRSDDYFTKGGVVKGKVKFQYYNFTPVKPAGAGRDQLPLRV